MICKWVPRIKHLLTRKPLVISQEPRALCAWVLSTTAKLLGGCKTGEHSLLFFSRNPSIHFPLFGSSFCGDHSYFTSPLVFWKSVRKLWDIIKHNLGLRLKFHFFPFHTPWKQEEDLCKVKIEDLKFPHDFVLFRIKPRFPSQSCGLTIACIAQASVSKIIYQQCRKSGLWGSLLRQGDPILSLQPLFYQTCHRHAIQCLLPRTPSLILCLPLHQRSG